jgi:hypothetical protein
MKSLWKISSDWSNQSKSDSFQMTLFSLDRSHGYRDGVLEKTLTHDLDLLAQSTDCARNWLHSVGASRANIKDGAQINLFDHMILSTHTYPTYCWWSILTHLTINYRAICEHRKELMLAHDYLLTNSKDAGLRICAGEFEQKIHKTRKH